MATQIPIDPTRRRQTLFPPTQGIARGEPTPGGGMPVPFPDTGERSDQVPPASPTPSPAPRSTNPGPLPPRSTGGYGTGSAGKDGMGHADNRDAANEYRARAGDNPRTGRGQVVNGRWQGTGRDDLDGLTIEEMNSKISQWDRGYNLAVNGAEGNYGREGHGGGGSGGAGGGSGSGTQAADGTIQSDMEGFIRGLMSGEEGPFTDEIQATLRGQSAARRSADLLNANQNATLAAARGGTAGSPADRAVLAANQRAAREGAASDAQGIKITAAQENFKARLTGLDQAQATVQREYQDRWNAAQNATQRYIADQEFKAKMEEINAQRDSLNAQLQASGSAASRARGWELEDRADQRAYEQSIYERDLPLELLRYQLGTVG